MHEYSITCQSGKFSGHWVVRRLVDNKVMTQGDVKTCLRWVQTWGQVDLGR